MKRGTDGRKSGSASADGARLKRLESDGEAVHEPRSYFGPLPEIRLAKPAPLDRIIRAAKR